MKLRTVKWSAIVAAAFACLCVFGEVIGYLVVLAVGLAALIVLVKNRPCDVAVVAEPQFKSFLEWGACVFLFSGFVVCLAPFASMPAVIAALVLLSPLFGTWVYLATSAIIRMTA